MLSRLVEAGYLAGNPLTLSRRKRRHAAPRVSRFLPMEHWTAVKSTIEAMPVITERDRLHASRCRWLFSLLYVGGLRVSEICGGTMGGFFGRRDADGRERWWLEVTGKGSKTRLVPATCELMAELVRYRRTIGLSPLPQEGEAVPLVVPIIGPTKPMARSAIHEIVKTVVRESATRLRQRGAEFEAGAAHLEQAYTHLDAPYSGLPSKREGRYQGGSRQPGPRQYQHHQRLSTIGRRYAPRSDGGCASGRMDDAIGARAIGNRVPGALLSQDVFHRPQVAESIAAIS
jgi:hypothetical protein